MSKVNKCDFCGAIYDGTKSDVSCMEGEVARDAYICIYGTDTDTAEAYDVCPQCTDKIRSLIDVMRSGDNFTIDFISKEE